MLYFSKFKSFTIMIISFFGIIFALPNILSQEIIDSLPNILPKKQINLGLDLRGGSHLLIEVDASVLAIERMDNIYNDLRLELRKNKIDISTIDQRNDEITITISQASSIKDVFSILEELSQEMGFNSSGQPNNELDILEVSENTYTINLTDAAIDSLTRRSVDQSIEIDNQYQLALPHLKCRCNIFEIQV